MVQPDTCFAEYYYYVPTNNTPKLLPDFVGVYFPATQVFYDNQFKQCKKKEQNPTFNTIASVRKIAFDTPSEVYALFETVVKACHEVERCFHRNETEAKAIEQQLRQNFSDTKDVMECELYEFHSGRPWFEVFIPSEKQIYDSRYVAQLRPARAKDLKKYTRLPKITVKINRAILERIKGHCNSQSQYMPLYETKKALSAKFEADCKLLLEVKAKTKLL